MLRKSARSIWISTINKMVEHQPRKRTIHVLLNRTVLLATNTPSNAASPSMAVSEIMGAYITTPLS
jgi:hypothetical protein